MSEATSVLQPATTMIGPLTTPPTARLTEPTPPRRWFRFNAGKPMHHAFIAGATAAITSSLWWSLFLFGGKESATTLQILISTMVPGTVLGGAIAHLIHDSLELPFMEGILKPMLAKAVARVGLSDFIRTLRGNQGLPDYQYNLLSYRINAVEHELSLHLAAEGRRKLMDTIGERVPNAVENERLARYDKAIDDGMVSLRKEKQKLMDAGLPPSPNPYGDDDDDVAPSGIGIDARWGTFFGATALTAGAMVMVNGAPGWTKNTQDLLTFFGIHAFFGMFIDYVYYVVIQSNYWLYVVRPWESWINRKTGVNFFTAAAHNELAIPEPERYKITFDRGLEIVNNLTCYLEEATVQLRAKAQPLTEEETERLEIWDDSLARSKQLVDSIQATLKRLDPNATADVREA